VPEDLSHHLGRLKPFAALMPARLGMDLVAFGRCCRAVAVALGEETGYQKVRLLGKVGGALRFQAYHDTLAGESLCAEFLFSVMQRGLLRTSKHSWRKRLGELVGEAGAKNPTQEVDAFLARFTRLQDLDLDLGPSLFLEVDQRTLALDLLFMGDFFEFCLRKLTAVDDAPDPTARRGAHFEQAAWALIAGALPARLAVSINKHLRRGPVKGEIDIAFYVGNILVVLECKSWQKTLAYFRGDRAGINRRQEQLRDIVERQMTRNIGLLRHHLQIDSEQKVLSFVCVPGPEFIRRDYTMLWYGNWPRVLTPQELITLIKDAPHWQGLVRAAP
jgi:hypothetical protein